MDLIEVRPGLRMLRFPVGAASLAVHGAAAALRAVAAATR